MRTSVAWRSAAVVAAVCLVRSAEGTTWGPEAMEKKTGKWYNRCCPEVSSNSSDCPNSTFVPEVKPKLCDEGGEGVFLPFSTTEWEISRGARGFYYAFLLFYFFAGVAVMADAFMGAIEAITSRRVVKKDDYGRQYHVEVWNPTVANLTLMALGSSAPEIILSLIEICVSNKFYAGALGPGTIVGSAAFNLMFIIGICTMAIPNPEDETLKNLETKGYRRINEYGVFQITAVFSIGAYLWLLVILLGPSPDVVAVWEGTVTLLFFPLLTVVAWVVDVISCGGSKDKDADEVEEMGADETGDEVDEPQEPISRARRGSMMKFFTRSKTNKTAPKPEPTNVQMLKESGLTKAELMASDPDEVAARIGSQASEPTDDGKRTRASYRRTAMQSLSRPKEIVGPGVAPLTLGAQSDMEKRSVAPSLTEAKPAELSLQYPQYTCLENCGQMRVSVTRGGNTDERLSVDYVTVKGTAVPGTHYTENEGTLMFEMGERKKSILIDILQNDVKNVIQRQSSKTGHSSVINYDDEFQVKIFNAKPGGTGAGSRMPIILLNPITTVTIVDDDQPGYLTLAAERHRIMENHGSLRIQVLRKGGCGGEITCEYTTKDGSAIAPSDYIAVSGVLTFKENEIEKFVDIKIIDDDIYEQDETFTFEISEPTGGADLGDIRSMTIVIENDDEMKTLLDKITAKIFLNRNRLNQAVSSWKQQFVDATRWPGEESTAVKVIHVIMVPWKFLGACIAPPRILGGWLCFIMALSFIGIVTAVIGDLAGLFGCVVGLTDQVTAITFVALGTSLPDTFASKMAATQETSADAAITNVTGSNSVNVFLGLGLPWLIAAIYWEGNSTAEWAMTVPCWVGQEYPSGAFYVNSGSLAFSVTIFTMCAVVTFAIMMFRRASVGGELGGPGKNIVAGVLMSLWFVYILISSLQSEGNISGF